MRELDSWEHDEVVTRLGTRSGVPITVRCTRGRSARGRRHRLRHYPHWRDGLADALRLSSGMTHKCAAAGLPFARQERVGRAGGHSGDPRSPRGSAGRPG